jgi:predicted outer membrane repeat protein
MAERYPRCGARALIAGALTSLALVGLVAPVAGAGGSAPATTEGQRRPARGCVRLADEVDRANRVDDHDVRIDLDRGCPQGRQALVIRANNGRQVTIDGHGSSLSGGHVDSLLRIRPGAVVVLEALVFYDSDAGAIENEGGRVEIRRSTFLGNRGGAIENASGRLVISDSTFTRNRAGEGGALLSDGGNVTITRSTFAHNVATQGDGGAILMDGGRLTIVNSTFSGNSSGRGGGAIASVDATKVTLTSSTLWGNVANSGGGLTGPATVDNTIVAGNQQGNCGAGALLEGEAKHGPPNNIADTHECGKSFFFSDAIGIDTALVDNGGSTATHALLQGSAAVDAGANRYCAPTDQRGVARARDKADPCDIGAFEGVALVDPDPEPLPTVSARPVNDAPDAARSSATAVPGGEPLGIDLARLVVDAETADGDLVYELTGPEPTEGELSLVGSVLIYSAGDEAAGRDVIGYRVTDRGAPDGCTGGPESCAAAKSATARIVVTISSGESTSPPPPQPLGPDLFLEEVILELVPGDVSAGPGGRAILAAGEESLHLSGRIVNNGDEPSTATTLAVTTTGWEGPPIAVPPLMPGEAVEIDESMDPPPGVEDDTKFTVTIGAVEGETDATNNAKPNVLAVRAESGGSRTVVVIVVLAIVLAAVAVAVLMHLARRVSAPSTVSVHGHDPAGGAAAFDGLTELADAFLGAEPGPPLWEAGRTATGLRDALGDDEAARLIGTMFWRAFVESHQLDDLLREAGASDAARAHPEVLVVPHAGGSRFDLVVLDAQFSGEEPSPVTVTPDSGALVGAWSRASARTRLAGAALLKEQGFARSALAKVLEEVAGLPTFGIVVVRKPELVLTSSLSPPWGVASEEEEPSSTAGVVVVDSKGRTGVTVADHAVRGREKVMIDGRLGTIVSSDPISDSAFVEVELAGLDLARGQKGPLSGVSPRQMEVAEFDGVRSGKTSTRVTGWDPTILTTESFIQTKIVTEPVTLPGDSGAALVDGDGHILGFAFYTTGLNQQPAHSGWIWAESVYRAHGLHPWVEGGP